MMRARVSTSARAPTRALISMFLATAQGCSELALKCFGIHGCARLPIHAAGNDVEPISAAPQYLAPRRKWALRHFQDRKSTRLNSSHQIISYAVFCLKKKKTVHHTHTPS